MATVIDKNKKILDLHDMLVAISPKQFNYIFL